MHYVVCTGMVNLKNKSCRISLLISFFFQIVGTDNNRRLTEELRCQVRYSIHDRSLQLLHYNSRLVESLSYTCKSSHYGCTRSAGTLVSIMWCWKKRGYVDCRGFCLGRSTIWNSWGIQTGQSLYKAGDGLHNRRLVQ